MLIGFTTGEGEADRVRLLPITGNAVFSYNLREVTARNSATNIEEHHAMDH